MPLPDQLGPSAPVSVVRFRDGAFTTVEQIVATEVPLTILANDVEVATLLCTPSNLKELAAGFLFTSGVINIAAQLLDCRIDTVRWTAECTVDRTPDPALFNKRLYTSGCGRGTMFASAVELAGRHPIESAQTVAAAHIHDLAVWLQHCSSLYRETGGIHSAALSAAGATPAGAFDDIGRHNAVDKVIGAGLLAGTDFSTVVLICSGRTSSEILHKVRRAAIPIAIARGAPTNQTVLKARDMGITVVGFARGGGFTVFSHPERIV